MMIEDSGKLQETILVLNDLLQQGDKMKTDCLFQYNTQRNDVDFDFKGFIKTWESKMNFFVGRTIYDSLRSNLSHNYHLLFHYNNPLPLALNNPAWNKDFNRIYFWFLGYLNALKDIIFKLEDQLVIAYKREIAKQELDQNILYKISYSEHSRRIKINGIDLSKPDFDTPPERLFSYLFARANQVVNISDFEIEMNLKLTRTPSQILGDLGFKKELSQLFFPIKTKSQIKFVNPITNKYAVENELPCINLKKSSDSVRKSPK